MKTINEFFNGLQMIGRDKELLLITTVEVWTTVTSTTVILTQLMYELLLRRSNTTIHS